MTCGKPERQGLGWAWLLLFMASCAQSTAQRLDRAHSARSRAHLGQATDQPQARDPARSRPRPQPDATQRGTRQAAEPNSCGAGNGAAPPGAIPPALAQADLHRALARYAQEPKVARVVQWALQRARRGASDLPALARRARRSGLIPKVSLSVRHGQAIDLVDTQDTDLASRLRVSSDQHVTLYGALTFDLPKLLFAPVETSLAREQRFASAAQRKLIPQLVALYFERRKLQLLRDLQVRDDVELHVRIMESEALLDAFTGGRFSSMIKPTGAPPTATKDRPNP